MCRLGFSIILMAVLSLPTMAQVFPQVSISAGSKPAISARQKDAF